MNLTKHTDIWVPLKSVLAVNLMGYADDQYRAEWVIMSRSKGKVIRIEQKLVTGTLAEICNQLPTKYPVVLTLDGKGVLYKTGEPEWTNTKQIFRELVPQANYNDFYLMLYPNPSKLWVAISRKTWVQSILKELTDKKLEIVDLQFGPFILEKTKPLVADESLEWNLPTRKIEWEENKITAFSAAQSPFLTGFNLGGEEIESDYILSFTHALIALTQFDGLNTDFDDITQNRNQYIYKQRIQKVGVSVLIFYLGLLLVNYLLFTNYNEKLNLTQASYQGSLKTINRLENLSTELKQKEALAKKVGFGDREQLSYLADQLAASLPSYITLTSMDINPLIDKQRNRETPQFQAEMIQISGELNNGVKLYGWIESLKQFPWVTSVEVMKLEQEVTDKPAVFTLLVSFHLSSKQINPTLP
ncbi:MAG: hypothetical protein WCX31_02300 [Salinivirgaceae bacterium]